MQAAIPHPARSTITQPRPPGQYRAQPDATGLARGHHRVQTALATQSEVRGGGPSPGPRQIAESVRLRAGRYAQLKPPRSSGSAVRALRQPSVVSVVSHEDDQLTLLGPILPSRDRCAQKHYVGMLIIDYGHDIVDPGQTHRAHLHPRSRPEPLGHPCPVPRVTPPSTGRPHRVRHHQPRASAGSSAPCPGIILSV
jgi:hypothetical protein